MSPTARTLAYLRAIGCLAAVVEKWNPYAKIRQDVFKIIDIIAICRKQFVAIQATSGSNHSARIKKVLASDAIIPYLETKNQFQVWSWTKKEREGDKRKVWAPRITTLTLTGDSEIVTSDQ